MHPPLAMALGLSALFLAFAHGVLHHFLAVERPRQRLPARAALLPWPTRGRAVGLLALIVSLAFLVVASKVGAATRSSVGATGVFLLFASPLIVHVAWVASCMRRIGSTWVFVPRSPTLRSLGTSLVPYPLLAAIALCGVVPAGLVIHQDVTHAGKVFANRVAYEDVLASRRWHGLADVPGCTYAVVSLKDDASRSPPDSWLERERWARTPVRLDSPVPHGRTTNPVSVCVEEGRFPAEVAARLQEAVGESGSYYIHVGETLLVYSARQRVAAVVRHGD
jgi:hypothetical protein